MGAARLTVAVACGRKLRSPFGVSSPMVNPTPTERPSVTDADARRAARLGVAGSAPCKVVLVGGNAQSLWNFRGPLIRLLVASGATVVAGAPDLGAEDRDRIAALGADAEEISIDRAGTNPLGDLRTVFALRRLLRRHRPATFVGYTVKPVCLGILAAALARVPNRVALIEGLGFAFGRDTARQRVIGLVVRGLYRLALAFAHSAVFLNEDDRSLFVAQCLVSARKTLVVDGAGIDVAAFAPSPPPPAKPFTFALIARLLYDKGLREYVEAARIVRQEHPDTRFVLAGPFDANPAAVSQDEVAGWGDVIDYVGSLDDVRPVLRASHVYVLPSYREGVPRTVLEAMSIGRPIIVSDAPGCRVTVSERHRNGLLVEPRNARALAEAMIWMLDHQHELSRMGRASRAYAIERFEADRVGRDFIDRARLLAAPQER